MVTTFPSLPPDTPFNCQFPSFFFLLIPSLLLSIFRLPLHSISIIFLSFLFIISKLPLNSSLLMWLLQGLYLPLRFIDSHGLQQLIPNTIFHVPFRKKCGALAQVHAPPSSILGLLPPHPLLIMLVSFGFGKCFPRFVLGLVVVSPLVLWWFRFCSSY